MFSVNNNIIILVINTPINSSITILELSCFLVFSSYLLIIGIDIINIKIVIKIINTIFNLNINNNINKKIKLNILPKVPGQKGNFPE
jgi:hypothetical protein